MTKSGWKPEGIHLYNQMYQCVTEDRIKNNIDFDAEFMEFVESKKTSKKQRNAIKKPYAYNDLS